MRRVTDAHPFLSAFRAKRAVSALARTAVLALTLTAMPALVLTAGPALAHKVNVFAVAEGGVVSGEAYFGDGAKAMDSAIELRDASDALLGSTRTGRDGMFSLPLPTGATAPLRVVLKAGEGHGNDFTLTAKDLGQATPSAPGPDKAEAAPAQARLAPASLDQESFKALVAAATAKAVEEKMAPLRLELAKLASQEQSTRLRDIVGGVGWIVGLVGIAAWFKRPGKK